MIGGYETEGARSLCSLGRLGWLGGVLKVDCSGVKKLLIGFAEGMK